MYTHAALCIASNLTEASLPEACATPAADVHHEVADVLQIETVRSLRQYAYQAPVTGSYRWLVVSARVYTHAAQNALLKILEEPPQTTKIILVVPSIEQLLPTVRSRLSILSSDNNTSTAMQSTRDEAAHNWIHSSVADRLDHVAQLHKKGQGMQLSQLLSAVTQTLATQRLSLSAEQQILLADIVQFSVRSGASRKYLLEAVAIAMPIIAVSE